MNAIAAAFLYVLPEVDAFFCLRRLLVELAPRYVTPSLDGVEDGCALVGAVIQAVGRQRQGALPR